VSFVEILIANSMNLARSVSPRRVYELSWSNAPSAHSGLTPKSGDDAGGRGVSDPVLIVVGRNGAGSHTGQSQRGSRCNAGGSVSHRQANAAGSVGAHRDDTGRQCGSAYVMT